MEKKTFKGFLYQTEQGNWVLSEKPHLNSCCIGNFSKEPQIFLEGDFSSFPSYRLVTLRGFLQKEPVLLQGHFHEKKWLTDIEISQRKEFPVYSSLFLGILLCSVLMKKKILKFLRLPLP